MTYFLLLSVSLYFPEFYINKTIQYVLSSVQFSRSVVSDSLRPHESQHARPPCPSPTPSPLKLTSIESVMPSSHLILCCPLLLLPPIPPSIRVFSRVNSSHEVAKVLEFQLQHHSFQRNLRADLLQNGLVGSLCSPRDSQESSPTPQFKSINSLALSFLHSLTLTSIHDHWKTLALTRQTFVGKVMSLLLNMLSRLVITFLPRSKRLLISWLQSPSAVILEPKKIKSDTVSTVSPSISHEGVEQDAMIFIFWMLSFKPTFSLSSFAFIKRHFSSSSLSAIRVVSSAYLKLLIFLPAILIPACASSSPAFLMMYSA